MDLNNSDKIRAFTANYEGKRFEDGRPMIATDLLKRMAKVTIEEAWGVLAGKDHHFQFEGEWVNLHPDRTIVGRAVTCRYVPHRADLNEVVQREGEEHGRIGGQNSWVIDTLVEGDVLVVELFGKVVKGTFIGDNLGTAVAARTGGTGLVIDGSIRDDHRVRQLPMNVFCKGLHPTAIGEVTMVDMNGPVRIGAATALPGDIVLGTPTGVIFIPPQYAQEVVENSENTRLRDYWGKESIRDGKYTPGEVDRGWSEVMTTEFEQWRDKVDVAGLEF